MLEVREQSPDRIVIGVKTGESLARITIAHDRRSREDVKIEVLGLSGDEVFVSTHVSMSEARIADGR